MPTIRDNDDTSDIYLTGVDHLSNSEDAAQKLWESILEASRIFGGTPILSTPEETRDGYHVQWRGGPNQWADAYVVSEGADAPEFASEASGGDTVIFRDLN